MMTLTQRTETIQRPICMDNSPSQSPGINDFSRDPDKDPFILQAVQCFHGPLELKLTSNVLSFGFKSGSNKGCMVMSLSDSIGSKLSLEIVFTMLDQITFLPPDDASGLSGALSLHFKEKCCKKLLAVLRTETAISQLMRRNPSNIGFAQRQLVIVLAPWKPENPRGFVQMGLKRSSTAPILHVDTLLALGDRWISPTKYQDERRLLMKRKSYTYREEFSRFFATIALTDWQSYLDQMGIETIVPRIDEKNYRAKYENMSSRVFHQPSGHKHQQQHPGVAHNESAEFSQNNRPTQAAHNQQQQQRIRNQQLISQHPATRPGYQQTSQSLARVEVQPVEPLVNVRPDVSLGEFLNLKSSKKISSHQQQARFGQHAPNERVSIRQDPLSTLVSSLGIEDTQPAAAAPQSIPTVHPHRTPAILKKKLPSGLPAPQISACKDTEPEGFENKSIAGSQTNGESKLDMSIGSQPDSQGEPATKFIPSVVAAKKKNKKRAMEVETIALDDDEEEGDKGCAGSQESEAGTPKDVSPGSASSSTTANTQAEVAGEPIGKKARVERVEPINGDTLLLQYPSTGPSRERLSIHFDDVRVLAHGEMLNDTIVEFYLKHILRDFDDKNQGADLMKRVHVFSTFFFQKLTANPPSGQNHYEKRSRSATSRFNWIKRNYATVKGWTRKVNIFEKDYLVVPINDEMHWYLVIIIRPRLAVREETLSDAEVEKSRIRGASRQNPATYMLVLDSLQDKNDTKRGCVADILRDYLECELEDKKSLPGRLHRTHIAPILPLDVPRQRNYVDCGLYLVAFVEKVLTEPLTEKQLSTAKASWAVWYPHFDEVFMKFMRTKVIRKLRELCPREKWAQLCEYEASQKRGLTVLSEDAIVDFARRPRRHSACGVPDQPRHPRYQTRDHSEPPDTSSSPNHRGNAVSNPVTL